MVSFFLSFFSRYGEENVFSRSPPTTRNFYDFRKNKQMKHKTIEGEIRWEKVLHDNSIPSRVILTLKQTQMDVGSYVLRINEESRQQLSA